MFVTSTPRSERTFVSAIESRTAIVSFAARARAEQNQQNQQEKRPGG